MPIYSFQAEDGEIIDRVYSMAEAPSIGSVLEVDGKAFKRVFCGTVGDGTIAQRSKYPYLSSSLSAKMPGANVVRDPRSGKLKPEIRSRKHENELMARHGLVRD